MTDKQVEAGEKLVLIICSRRCAGPCGGKNQ